MGLQKYILRRMLGVTIVFFVILTALFILFRLAPGDPVSRMVDPNLTPEDAAYLIEQLGLNQPLGVISAKLFNLTDSPYYHMLSSNIMVEVKNDDRKLACVAILFSR